MSLEQLPSKISRRKLLTALGAGVVVATLYAARQPLGIDAGTTVGREAESSRSESYPVHNNIITTVFWVGEAANAETNDSIHNYSSVWVEDWAKSFGGIDDPLDRCGYKPCGFEPKENPFYFALPFSDYNEKGPKSDAELAVVPWFDGKIKDGESVLKNRWAEFEFGGKKVYGQWEDVGPFGEDDASYVFGDDQPKEPRAGLDVSPAIADYLGIDGRANTSWRFVEESDVPDGPWREIITTAGPQW